ncbi:MAG: AmmeMemoRadiSam system protein B [Bacteroidales bacterium]|nr:AmmeMemoRadiSam system protein B [Bacteroidales bacterium]
MYRIKTINFILLLLLVINYSCNSQNDMKNTNKKLIDRQPYCTRGFYPSTKTELERTLNKLFTDAVADKHFKNVRAIIAPHAGLVFSGETAASAFNQIDCEKEYKNIFVIASSHSLRYKGASIYNIGNYITPMGTVNVDIPLATKLINENDIFCFNNQAHQQEHSLEIELPFLQHILNYDFKIIPVLLGTNSAKDCKKIAEVLKPYFNEDNLFVISSDFSHYPSYSNAIEIDGLTAKAIESNSPENLLETLESNSDKGIFNLATSLCGWTSVLTLLYITENTSGIEYNPIQYKNSGDSPYGEKDRVVGYYSFAVTQKSNKTSSNSDFELNEKDKKDLLSIARKTITSYITKNVIPDFDPMNYSENLNKKCGAFVTLHNDGNLRGCIGRFSTEESLIKVVKDMAISSSTQDSRFPRVNADEIDQLDIEISVLTPMKKIDSIDEIELGKHGIYIKKGYSSGTFLPQVATETGWTLDEFVGHCSRDKAGIGWKGWKNADIYTYEAIVFSESEIGD